MTGTDFCVNKPHMSQSYLNHHVLLVSTCKCGRVVLVITEREFEYEFEYIYIL